MGYVHDTHFAQHIHVLEWQFTTGTWTIAEGSNIIAATKTDGDESSTILIPIVTPSNEIALKGAKLKSIDIFYSIATAALDAFDPATIILSKMTLPATGSAVSGAAVTETKDTAHDTDAENLAIDDHKLTVTITTPEWVDDGDMYWLEMILDFAATSVLKFYGAVAHYDLRA